MPIIFAACFFIGKNVAQAVEPPAHLWHFDECAGQVLSDSVGVEDLTQKAIWTPGKWQCGINQPYQSPYFLDKFFSQAMPPGELTISYYWRNSSYPYEGRNHLYLKNYYDQVLAGIRLSPNSRCLYLQGDDIVSQSGAPHDDAWHLVTVTYSAEQMVFYLDGFIQAAYPGDYAINDPIYGLEIRGENFPVEMDELALWSRALRADEVTAIFNSYLPLEPFTPRPEQSAAQLIHLWRFDESAGSTAADSVSQTDLSPIVNWADGRFGSGFEQSYQSQYTISRELDPAIDSRDLSLDFWFRNISYPNEGRGSLEFKSSSGENIFGIRFSPTNNGFYFNGSLNLTGNIIPHDADWHHLALVYDSYGLDVYFYVDGQEKFKIPKVWLKEPITRLMIRGENWPYRLDELAVWQGALTATEIKAHYDSGQPHVLSGLEPVIIIPGMMGSYLYGYLDPGEEVWPAIAKTVLDPWDFHLNQLILDELGQPLPGTMITPPQDIIRSLMGKEFFSGLIDELKANGYTENENLFVFPYDWRLDLNWTAGDVPYEGFSSLKEKIEEVKLKTGASKVNLIAHSLGGLVAKLYLKKFGTDSVNKFIDLGTPHLGATGVVKALMYGDDLGTFAINQNRIKVISQNFPSIYQALPSQNYFNQVGEGSYYLFDLHDLDNNGVTGRLNYEQSLDLLKNSGRNPYLLSLNRTLHEELDNYSPKIDGVKTYNLVGCGLPTLSQIFILNKERSGGSEYGIKYSTGDTTVPLESAEALSADKTIYAQKAAHSGLPSSEGPKEAVLAALDGALDNFNWENYPQLSLNAAGCVLNGTQVSFHSPVELEIYDETGNRLGLDENGDVRSEIEGARFDLIEGNKFAFLPAGRNYRIEGRASQAGVFNARIERVENSQYLETVYYNDAPLSSELTRIKIDLGQEATASVMSLDQDGDGIFEAQLEPSAVLNPAEAGDLVKPITEVNLSGTAGLNGYYLSPVELTLSAGDNPGGSGILKTEYSLDGGENWNNYKGAITLTGDGQYNISYKSIDRAGNWEEMKEQTIKIDQTGPEINVFLPLAGQELLRGSRLTPEYEIADNFSGLASSGPAILIDNQPLSDKALDIFGLTLGGHELTVAAADLAGNRSAASINFSVIANLESALEDIDRCFNQDWIYEPAAHGWLAQELTAIMEYEKTLGQKQTVLEGKELNIINECERKKDAAWCQDKLDNYYDRETYRLEQMNDVLVKKYQAIISQLDTYLAVQWLNLSAYDIIKADLNYLINNIK